MNDREFTEGMGRAESKAHGLASTAKQAGQTVATMFTGAAAATGGVIASLVKTGAGYNTLQQNSRAALKTLLGSTEAVNEQMSKLNDLASRSPFAKTAFITAQQQLLSFGVEVEKTIPMLDALQNAVAATGGSSQNLQDLAFILAQIKAAGKITGQDLLQLGQRGINAAELIGQSFGKTAAEIKKDITDGKISADDALDAITTGMQTKFGGTTDLVKQQWSGAVDRIKAAWRDMGADIAEPFISPTGGGKAVVWGNLVADTLRSVQKKVRELVKSFTNLGGGGFDKITHGLQQVNVWVSKINTAQLVADLHRLTKYAPLVSALGAAFTTLGARSIPVIGGLAASVNPLLVAVVALAAASPQVRAVGQAFTNGFAPAVPALADAARAIGDLGMTIIAELSPSLTQVAGGLGIFAGKLVPLVTLAAEAATAFIPLATTVLQLATAVLQLPSPVLAAAAAFLALRGPASQLVSTITSLSGPLKTAGAAISLFIGQASNTGVVDAARQSFSGLGSSLAGLVSPAGLVTAGLTILVGVLVAYAQRKAEANRKAQEFADTLDKETGAVTENSRAWVAKQAEEQGLIAQYKKMGGNARDLTNALLGEAGARDRVNQTVQAYADKHQSEMTTYDRQGNLVRKAGNAVDEFKGKLDGLASVTEEGVAKNKRLAEATEDSTVAFERQQAILDRAADALRAYSAAQGNLTDANYRAHDAVEKLNSTFAEMTSVTRDASGSIDWFEQSNRKFMETSRDTVQAQNDQLNAMKNAGATQEDLNAKIASNRAYWESWASQLGMSADETQDFITKLGLLSSVESTRIDITTYADTDEATAAVQSFIDSVRSNQDGLMTINADNAPAIDSLMQAIGITQNSDGTYTINANDDPAVAALLASLGIVDSSTGTVTIDGNNQYAMNQANAAVSAINGMDPSMSIRGTDNVSSVAQSIFSKWNGSSIVMNIVQKVIGSNMNGSVTDYYANGGIEFYANGGRRGENHVAQIAPAGAWRVWAEPETGGEAYIPLASTKRGRSRSILAEVARRFGDVYIPAGSTAYANGSPTKDTPATTNIHVTAYVTNPFTGEEVRAYARTEAVKVTRSVL
nr:MAG TPA: tail tape measure protein [Caudoviricetes sp.]